MTNDQIDLVQTSFIKVVPVADAIASMFYSRLFEIAPELRDLFKDDMVEQGRKLIQMLGVVVENLNDLDMVIASARDLAVRHVKYGVEPAHYALVGEALIWTFKNSFGEDFTPPMEEAWADAYLLLASTMISATKTA